ncbi:hypothetical protein IY230_01495 [Acholeplasma laidlawii]|uniref:PF20097 family protein n=1 Tax=Acholeplasma laidlawii TaxID=2148 RepID=UPI0018C3065E|nr:PF20097 family protein [Acholeplasma laidlawii]MBG0762284.1 hypothetical protein [Acholeplasma laidlawii]
MECPKCLSTMKEGYIFTDRMPIMWLPKNKMMPLTIFGRPQDSIMITKTPFLTRKKAVSFYCRSCKFIITPVIDSDKD